MILNNVLTNIVKQFNVFRIVYCEVWSQYLAHKNCLGIFDTETYDEIMEIFRALDRDGDSLINVYEMKEFLAENGLKGHDDHFVKESWTPWPLMIYIYIY